MKEDNILLAEFLGVKVNQLNGRCVLSGDLYTALTKVYGIKETVYRDRPMLFHVDWAWLMVVVEKIETLSMQPEFFVMYDNREEFKGWYWNISVRKLFNKDCLNRESTKIIAYYNACIEFVKWYNK